MRNRKDVMKPQPIDRSKKPTPDGGMAHSLEKDVWGDKLPPAPRSDLFKTRESIKSGMGLIVK